MSYLYGLRDIGYVENREPQAIVLIHVSQVKGVIFYRLGRELRKSLMLD